MVRIHHSPPNIITVIIWRFFLIYSGFKAIFGCNLLFFYSLCVVLCCSLLCCVTKNVTTILNKVNNLLTGIDIVLFESKVDEDGYYVGKQDCYERANSDTIYLDINAGLTNVN